MATESATEKWDGIFEGTQESLIHRSYLCTLCHTPPLESWFKLMISKSRDLILTSKTQSDGCIHAKLPGDGIECVGTYRDVT